MSRQTAHQIQHALLCGAYGNGILANCTCGAPGAASAKARREARIASREAIRAERMEAISKAQESVIADGGEPVDTTLESVTSAMTAVSTASEEDQRRRDARDLLYKTTIERLQQLWIAARTTSGKSADEIEAAKKGLLLEVADRAILDWIGDGVSAMSGRLVAVSRPSDWDPKHGLPITITQICPVCREQHVATIGQGDALDPMAITAIVGSEARRRRYLHRCAEITLDGIRHLSSEDIAKVAAELERDGTNMVERSQQINQLANQRAASAKLDPQTEPKSGKEKNT